MPTARVDPDLFLESLLEIVLPRGVLAFGEFTTKSGRLSPYFFNTGLLADGAGLTAISKLYAQVYHEKYGENKPRLFGPAYKGITLAAAVSMQLWELYGWDVGFLYNRKEAKDHGEAGVLVGAPLQENESLVIIEDVLTGGTSIRQTIQTLKDHKAKVSVSGAILAVDRQERGLGKKLARQELEEDWQCPVHSLATMNQIICRLSDGPFQGKNWLEPSQVAAARRYLQEYGSNG